ncbi:MAG: HD-GYP domain-containing protein [Burkholderiales bacterium]|nr:HD-GYP domain-containing protein [Burkholderiales bacterium]
MSRAKPSHLSKPVDEIALMSENTQLSSALKSLAIVNKELAFQNAEKEKRAAELVIANKELAFQNAEKGKRAAELVIANERLHGALMNTVRVAMILSELRDPYTAGHERRVAEISVAISAELGFDTSRQEGIRVAGYLHDVGKMVIPAEILAKPGKLTEIEYSLIKQHPQAGHDVLKGVEFPWPIAEVALQHHERMDGTGYPQGLRGEDIIVEARILAVADTVESMSSHRPYRAGLGIDKALAEIERGRGTSYDAAVAEVCLKLFREKGFNIPE